MLIGVEAISIEGGDVGNRARGEMPKVPHIVGYQCGGTILEVGAGVRDRKVGERVVAIMMHGSHAERVAVPAGFTFVVPEGLAVEVAACVPIPFGTADDCLFEFGRLQKGETVLDPGGRERGRDRSHAARETRGRDRDRDGRQRRKTRAPAR